MQISGFRIAYTVNDISYGIVDPEKEVCELEIDLGVNGAEGFSYFSKKFGIPYEFLLKKTIESGHVLAVAVSASNKLLAFARFEKMVERVERLHKGKVEVVRYPLYMLRSIEVHSSYRNTGIGRILFAVAVRSLGADIITKPDNPGSARFFKEKLMLGEIGKLSGIDQKKYSDYFMVSYPKASGLLDVLIERYPRMILPELIHLYEISKLKLQRNKSISSEDISRFEMLFAKRRNMLSNSAQKEMDALLVSLRSMDQSLPEKQKQLIV